MHLELVPCLRVKARLGVQSIDVGVNVHDEHGAAVVGEHVQVIDIQLASLSGKRRVEVMRHQTFAFIHGQARERCTASGDNHRVPIGQMSQTGINVAKAVVDCLTTSSGLSSTRRFGVPLSSICARISSAASTPTSKEG